MLKIPLLAMMFVMGVCFVQRSVMLMAVENLFLMAFLLGFFVSACWIFLRVKSSGHHQKIVNHINGFEQDHYPSSLQTSSNAQESFYVHSKLYFKKLSF